MAKVIIPVDKLPYPGKDGKHKVRFRITTKDYNEISEWSPIVLLDSSGQVVSASVSYSYDILTSTSGTKMINITWEDTHSNVDKNSHDVFVKWSYSAVFQYLGRESGNTTSIMVPATASTAVLKVQLPSYPTPPEESNLFKLFQTPTITL
jgi:hypothetical protein